MADSFFEFNTSLNQGLELVDEPELGEEEEYDALNDETFGTDAFQGDWEEDHTRFAEVTENSRTYKNSYNSEKDDKDLDLQASLSQFVLQSEDEDEDEEADNDAKLDSSKPANIFNKFPFDYIAGYSSPAWSTHSDEKSNFFNKPQQHQHHQHQHQNQHQQPNFQQLHPPVPRLPVTHFLPPQLSRIPTVQELETDLMQKNKQNNFMNKSREINQSIIQDKNYYSTLSNNMNDHHLNSNDKLSNLNIQQQNALGKFSQFIGSNKFPPGFGPLPHGHLNQPHQQEVANLRNNQNMPMQLGQFFFPPHLPMLLPHHILPHNPHPFLLSQNHRMMKPHLMMRFMPTHPLLMQQHQYQQQHYQKQQLHHKMQNNQDSFKNEQASQNQHNSSNFNHPWFHNPNRRGYDNYDEYAGLMNNRERQWLLNIQIIQLATDKPLVDDYYYMVWSKKQEKENEKKLKEETRNGLKKEKPFREAYFPNNRVPKNEINERERRNSEREIAVIPSKVYVPLQFENSLGKLQCGSVTAPRKIIDLDVVPERQVPTVPQTSHRDSRKAKKILLELESLYLLTMNLEDLENNLMPEAMRSAAEENSLSKPKLLEQIMNSYLNEDRFVNFMCVRKGKTLLLRVLLHLNNKDHSEQLTKLWCHLFKSLSVIIRRDQSDGILLQLYPYFKQWINTVDCTVLSIIASYLLTANVSSQAKKSSRAVSPNSGKSVLSYVLTTTFGVSAVSSILSRGESLYPVLHEKEKQDWTNFILNFIKHMTNSPNLESQIPTPLDPLPSNVVTVILNRSTGLHIQDYASAKRVLTAFNKDKSRS